MDIDLWLMFPLPVEGASSPEPSGKAQWRNGPDLNY